MIRPEVVAQLKRWREVLSGAGMVLLGLWWLIGPRGLLMLPAGALLVAGAALIWIGVQRARFRSVGRGPGSVTVDEGQITYFGPLTGGAVALRELSEVTLDKSQYPAHWRLSQPGQSALLIPVNAEGAEALFDAFATLPRLRTERMLTALHAKEPHAIVIWQRQAGGATPLGLH